MVFTRRSRRGLTFFEAMVVFTIIAILVALVYLATRRLMVESKVTRAREEQRVISRALQNYFVDNYSWPTQGQGLDVLNAPVSYLASIPQDIFANREPVSIPYAYRTYDAGGALLWLLVSRGPDGDIDIDEQFPPPVTTSTGSGGGSSPRIAFNALPELLVNLSYDPTNGLRSQGDIYTVAPFPMN